VRSLDHLKQSQHLLSSNMCEPLNEGWHYADGVSHSGVRDSLLVLNLPPEISPFKGSH
jgi:hypothetical protein